MKKLFLLLSFLSLHIYIFSQCETFEAAIVTVNPLCEGSADGSLNTLLSGGTEPYSVDIFDEDGVLLNPFGALEVYDLVSGWYYVKGEDAIGCFTIDSVFLIDPIALSLDYSTSDPTASDICDGSILIDTVYGDYESLTYYWAPNPSGSEDSLLDGACWGTYILVVTNENDCFVDYSIDLALYLSLNEFSENSQFSLINGSCGSVTIINESNEIGELICYDLAGKIICSTNLSIGTNLVHFPNAGIFLYQIKQNGVVVDQGKIMN